MIEHSQEEHAAPATINHEIKKLERCYRLAMRWTPPVAERVPYMPKLKVQNTRTGFVEDTQFDQLVQAAAGADKLWFRTLLELAFTYGFRQGELLGLRCGQVDLRNNVIRLEPGTTKNKEGRAVVLTAKARSLVEALVQDKPATAPLFTRCDGSPVHDYRWTWYAAAAACGLGKLVCPACKAEAMVPSNRCPACKARVRLRYTGKILHDFRRSAARQLRLAGVPETVIMATGGWKTQSVFRRYAIEAHTDQLQATQLLEQARARRQQAQPPQPQSVQPQPAAARIIN